MRDAALNNRRRRAAACARHDAQHSQIDLLAQVLRHDCLCLLGLGQALAAAGWLLLLLLLLLRAGAAVLLIVLVDLKAW
jgi:hypothetical protein